MRLSVRAVSMARSEDWSCPLRLPTPAAAHVAIASGVSQRVTSPRRTRARSYSAQFPTRYVVLYFGCTLDFTSRSCPAGGRDGQHAGHCSPTALNQRTNAPGEFGARDWHTRSTYARHRIRHGIRHTAALVGRRPCPHVPNDRLRYMLIGYARVSKADGSQPLDLQRDALRAA